MIFSKHPLIALFGATVLLLSSSVQAAVITAAASFDLSSLEGPNVTAITPIEYEASAENAFFNVNKIGSSPVSAVVDTDFRNGSASATADAGDLDPEMLLVSAEAFDAGAAAADLSHSFTYQAVSAGEVVISIDYTALYDLDGSSIGDSLISLIISDSLGGYDQVSLFPGDPTPDFGTLTASGVAATDGEIGTITLLASVGVDSGVAAIPAPSTLLMVALGLVAMRRVRRQ